MSHSSDFGGFWEDATREHTASIVQLLKTKGGTVQYTYDFGDSWKHSLKLEGVIDVEPDGTMVACVDGRRAAPPEDFGGIWAYEWTVHVSQDPMHPGYADAMERVEWEFARVPAGDHSWSEAGDWSRISGGEVAERPIAPVLKTGVVRATAGSNPALSANENRPGSSMRSWAVLLFDECYPVNG